MITKNDIIKMAKHVARRSKGRPDGRLMHPNRDWVVGFLVVTAVLISGMVHAGITFYDAWRYNPDTYTVNVTTTTYKDALVDDILAKYRERAAHYAALRGDIAPVIVEEETATSTDGVGTDESAESEDVVATTTSSEVVE